LQNFIRISQYRVGRLDGGDDPYRSVTTGSTFGQVRDPFEASPVRDAGYPVNVGKEP